MNQITDEQIEMLVDRLVARINQANTSFLMSMGDSIKQIRNLTPTQAQQLVQMLKYGESYDNIIREISRYTNLNIQDIDDIFSNYAEKDQLFYEKFYRYRNIPFVEYAENEALRRQTEALANIVKKEMYDFTRANVLGYTIRDLDGNVQFLGLRETYNRVLDEALANVGTGKETFDSAMTRIMKDIGGSGLKTVEYASGRSMRLDSAVRMHLKSRLRELHNENQELFGEEFGADGVEISVHGNPAEDHEEAQGRQFSTVRPSSNQLSEWEKLQTEGVAIDYTGKEIDLHKTTKEGVAESFRPISELNCYHYIFSIILGVSDPEYSDKQLKKIIDDNNKGFELDGKHYTNYQGTQLQRSLERAIREQKDTQILAKASDNMALVNESQQKITQLTQKYNDLLNASGLPANKQRMRVSGYRRVAKSKLQ